MKKPFRVSYRWLPRTFFPNLYGIFVDLTRGVWNVFRWIPVIWFDRDYDSGFLASIMAQKLRWMAANTEYWHVVGAERAAREMLVCAELLHRLREDDYFAEARKTFPGHAAVHAAVRHHREDLKYLGKILGRRLTSWWD